MVIQQKRKMENSLKINDKGLPSRAFLKKLTVVIGVVTAGLFFSYVNIHAASKNPIRIGGLFNMTGNLYSFGVGGHKSAEAAIKLVNQRGGIAGRPVEYVMEDAASNVQVGIRKMRKLIMENNCDFILGPYGASIEIACIPIAKEWNTIFFPSATALSITEEKGNRYLFRVINNSRQAMIAIGKVAIEQMGKRYYCLGADYEWGHSVADEAKLVLNAKGGVLAGEEYSPVGTEDFVPYLNKIDPKKVDILIAGYFTNDILKLGLQAHEMGLLKNMLVIGGAMPTGVSPKDFGPAGERIWFTGYGIHRMANIPENLKAPNRTYRDCINMDDEGRYKDSGEMGAPTYTWENWEQVYWIKRGIEKSGWESKKDNLKFITALEGMSVTAGYDFIQGGKKIRTQDHQVFADQYVSKIEKGNFVLKAVVKADDLYYEPVVDYTKEKVK